MSKLSSYTILNVDDNPAGRYARKRILERAGYNVVEAETGTDALRLLRERLPEAVLLDVNLPDINGLEVCRIIKADPRTCHIMVLQISATHITGADQIHGLEGGADTYLIEPVAPGVLIATIKALLRLYEREQENRKLISRLSESEEQFRALFQLSAVGQTQVDLTTGQFIRVNERFCEMTGYSEPELTQMSPVSMIHSDDRPAGRDACLRMIGGEIDEHAEEQRLVRKDGSIIWVNAAIRAIRDAAGRAVRTAGVVQDISSQKYATESLRRAHESLSLAQRAAFGGVWDYDVPSGQAYVSPEYRLLYGLEQDEPMSYERWLSLVAAEDRPAMAEAGQRLFTSGTEWSVEFRIDHPSRGRRWLAGLGRLERNDQGAPLRFSGINIDITALKQAEEALRLSEAEFRATFEYAAAGRAQISTRDGRILRVNRKLCDLLGYSSEELAGMTFPEITWPEDRDILTEQRFFAGEISEFATERRYRHKDGHPVWCTVICGMINDLQGRPHTAIADILDISDRKRIQLNADFLQKLGGEMARLSDADEITSLALRRTAEHLDVPRCGLVSFESADRSSHATQWSNDSGDLRQPVPMGDFLPPAVFSALNRGDGLAIDDVSCDPRMKEVEDTFARLHIASCAIAPYLSEGACGSSTHCGRTAATALDDQ